MTKTTPDSGIFEGISWSVSRLHAFSKSARVPEGGGGAGQQLARIRSRMEAAAPAHKNPIQRCRTEVFLPDIWR
jgi:hypothetical protein